MSLVYNARHIFFCQKTFIYLEIEVLEEVKIFSGSSFVVGFYPVKSGRIGLQQSFGPLHDCFPGFLGEIGISQHSQIMCLREAGGKSLINYAGFAEPLG